MKKLTIAATLARHPLRMNTRSKPAAYPCESMWLAIEGVSPSGISVDVGVFGPRMEGLSMTAVIADGESEKERRSFRRELLL